MSTFLSLIIYYWLHKHGYNNIDNIV